ncbi:MAG: hypothetical protein MJ252_22110 [archaeon]|nr:hypothetical protein [archaeon]
MALSKFRLLANLQLDLADNNQVYFIFENLRQLLVLNGKETTDFVPIVDVSKADIENFLNLKQFSSILTIDNILNESDQSAPESKMEEFLKEEEQNLRTALENGAPYYVYANEVSRTVFGIQKKLANRFINRLDDKNKEIGRELFESIFEAANDLVSLINLLYPKINDKYEAMKSQLETAMKLANEMDDYEEKYKKANKEKEIVKNEKKILGQKLEHLETENKKMYQSLMKNAKEIGGGNQRTNLTTNNPTWQKHYTNSNTNNPNQASTQNLNSGGREYSAVSMNTAGAAKMLTVKMTKDIMTEIYNSKNEFNKKCFNNRQPNETMEQYMYTFLNYKYGLKNLVIEWASSIINAIKLYSSEDYEINLFGKILRNELDEGSRILILSVKSDILSLLELYLKAKNPLKGQKGINEILEAKKEGVLVEEEWRSITEYLYKDLYKEDAQALENKIINYIQKNGDGNNHNTTYKGNEASNASLTSNYNRTGGPANNQSSFYMRNKPSREELSMLNQSSSELNISFKAYVKIITEYRIKLREKELKPLVKLFRKFDKDSDGIMVEEEFVQLIESIPYCQDRAEEFSSKFLSMIDPFNNKMVTFSEVVSIFETDIIEEGDAESKEPVRLIDKIPTDEGRSKKK